MIVRWTQTDKTTSKVVCITQIPVGKGWGRWLNFGKCGMKVWAELTWPKHCINLTAPDMRPVSSATYHAGPEARKIEKMETDKMHGTKVIEPAQSG